MPGFGAAVAGPDNDMNMQGGLALWIIGDVANQRSDLDLLADGNLLVVLLLPVKVEHDRVANGPDRGETRGLNYVTTPWGHMAKERQRETILKTDQRNLYRSLASRENSPSNQVDRATAASGWKAITWGPCNAAAGS
jgi:hypothetical protein